MASKKQGRSSGVSRTSASSLIPISQPSAQPAVDPISELVTMEAEVPEGLHHGLQIFLERRPGWDASSLLTSALASFLFQNGWSDPCVAQLYLEAIDHGLEDGVSVAA